MTSKHSLHRKFITVLVLIATTLAILAAALGYVRSYHYEMERGRDALRALAEAIDKTVAVAVYANDQILMRELISGLQKHSLVTEVSFFDAKLKPLLSTAKAGADSPTRDATAVDAVERVLVSPFDMREQIGRLRIVVNTAALQAEARRQATVLGLSMAVLTAILVVALNALAMRKLSQPLNQLAGEIARMEPGSPQRLHLPVEHDHDELGTVAQATNRLLQANEEALNGEREARREIAAMEAMYRQIFDFTSAGIFVLTVEGQLVSSNPTVARLLGASPQELSASLGAEFLDTAFLNADRARALIATATDSGETSSGDLAIRCTDGSLKWVHCLFSIHQEPQDSMANFIEGVMYDVTVRKREEYAVRQRAHQDPLTGLKNRAGTNASLDELVERARKFGGRLTVFYVDLDGFKAVNDQWGHSAGDAVLVECGRRLNHLVRQSSDFVGRLGGDELLVAVRDLAPEDKAVHELAAHIVAALSLPVDIGSGQQARVGASVGVAGFPRHAHTVAELLSEADRAMYAAKRAGKNRYAVAVRSPSAQDETR